MCAVRIRVGGRYSRVLVMVSGWWRKWRGRRSKLGLLFFRKEEGKGASEDSQSVKKVWEFFLMFRVGLRNRNWLWKRQNDHYFKKVSLLLDLFSQRDAWMTQHPAWPCQLLMGSNALRTQKPRSTGSISNITSQIKSKNVVKRWNNQQVWSKMTFSASSLSSKKKWILKDSTKNTEWRKPLTSPRGRRRQLWTHRCHSKSGKLIDCSKR